MRILYIGGGFVGTCSAAVSANSGHDVLVYDIDQEKIQRLGSGDRDTIESCLFEEGLGDLLVRNRERIRFTTDYALVRTFLDTCDAVFMCLPTPEIGETGESDLRYYEAAAQKLASALAERNARGQSHYLVVINKSTVPIMMVEKTAELLRAAGVNNVGVVANPEFLVEGKAIIGSLRPDRIVVGARDEQDFAIMRQLYQRFYDSPSVHYIEVTPEEAAAGKLLANFYLFNKLAVCFDVIGRTAEAFPGLKFENLRRILTTDPRIGEWGFYDSLYAGGSCFIKDARSLAHQLKSRQFSAPLVDETYQANQRQLERFLGRANQEAGFDWQGKTVALIGLAFKRDTNDTRNSPAYQVVTFARQNGAKTIQLFDPTAMDNFKKDFPPNDYLIYCSDERAALQGAAVVIIATDWPQWRGLADTLLASPARPLIMDGRRLLQHCYADLAAAGFTILAVGSPLVAHS